MATIDHRLLICSLCDRTFASPKLLPCLHVFCEPCIESYVKESREKRKSQERVIGLTVLPEQKELSSKQVSTRKPPPIGQQQSVESKEDSNSNRSRASTLDAQIPPQGYDDIPPHDATADFHRRGADRDYTDGSIYEEISAHTSPPLRDSLSKGARTGSAPTLRESFGPQYVAMNKSHSALDTGDLVVAALAGCFSDTSSAALSCSREALNMPLDSSSDRSDSQIYVPPSPDRAFPDVVPHVSPSTSLNPPEVQSEVAVTLQRNKTICGKASLMPGFVDNIRTRRNSKDKLLDEDISISKQPSMLSVDSRASSSSGCSPGDDSCVAAANSPTKLPKKSKDKTTQKRKSVEKSTKKTKKEQKRRNKVVPPMMRPLSGTREMQAIPEPPAECYHADVSHEDDYLYEMPVNTGPVLPPRRGGGPALPSPRGVPNVYIDNNTMRATNKKNTNEKRADFTQGQAIASQEEDHYDYVDSPRAQYYPSQKVTKALLRDKMTHYGPAVRKSHTLIDAEGYEYISDAFQKVKIKTNQGESEFLYNEVHQLEKIVDKETANRPRSDSQPSTCSVESLSENEFECPQCGCVFKFEKDVQELPPAKFIGVLQDIHFKQCLKPKTCSGCDSRHIGSECPTCHRLLCRDCDAKHQCSTMTSQPSEPVYGNVRARCANHTYNVCEYYCHTCSLQICNDCFVTSHRHHACALIEVVKSRTDAFLEDFQELSTDIKQVYEHEILQAEKYMMQYESEKEKVLSDITYAYVEARQLMEEAYCELSRHVNFRYEEEMNYVRDLRSTNKRFVDRIEHARCFARHLTTHGNQIDSIEMSRVLSEDLLELQSHDPIRLGSKLHVQFTASPSKPVDFIPLIGNACRVYNSIRRKTMLPQDALSRREKLLHARNPFVQIGVFKPRTEGDARGCKPTGVSVSKTGEIVIVDDINRKIKVFSEKGVLIQEVSPKGERSLIDPWDITMTHYGNFVVTDKGSKSVKIFDTDGEIVSEFGAHLASPWGVCTNSSGEIIVTDTAHKSVFIHDSIGNLKYQVNGPKGLLIFPEYVTANVNDDIIVSDFKGNCIHVFSSIGQFLFCIKSSTPNGKLFESPCGVTCDQQGNILLADFENARVCEFTSGGQFLSYILTKSDHIRGPQCLTTNRKVQNQTQKLFLVDGTEIKVYRRRNTVRFSKILDEEDLDLELKPKVYNSRKDREQTPGAPLPRRKLPALDISTSKADSQSSCSNSSDVTNLRPGQFPCSIKEQQFKRTSSLLSSPDTYDIPKVPSSPIIPIIPGTGHNINDALLAHVSNETPNSYKNKNNPIEMSSPVEGQNIDPPVPKPRHVRNQSHLSGSHSDDSSDNHDDAVSNAVYEDDVVLKDASPAHTRERKNCTEEMSQCSKNSTEQIESESETGSCSTPALLQESYRMSSVNRSTRNKPLIDKLIRQLGLEGGSHSDGDSSSPLDPSMETSTRSRSRSAANKGLKIPERFLENSRGKQNKRRSTSLTRNAARVGVRTRLNVSFQSDASEGKTMNADTLPRQRRREEYGSNTNRESAGKSSETSIKTESRITTV